MSHNVLTVNEQTADRDSNIEYSSGVVFDWVCYNGVNPGALAVAAGDNLPFYRVSSYTTVYTGTGVSVSNTARSPIASQYHYGWFDIINVPAGSYMMTFNAGFNSGYRGNGACAWHFDTSSTRISSIISHRTDHQNTHLKYKFTAPSGGIGISCRILTSSLYVDALAGLTAQQITIEEI